MKLATAGLVALTLVSIAQHADADCGNPHWVGTPTGASIPQRGSLYLFDGAIADGEELKHRGGPIKAETKVGPGVVKLDYVTQADELELADAYEPTLLNVNPMWRPPAAAPRVIQYWHQVSAWTCSSSDLVWLQIDQPTAAFRVVWEAKHKPARQFVFPAHTGDNNVSALPLGKLNCVGEPTIDPEELAAGGRLALFAIRYDGSEVAVTGLPQTLSTTQMPTTEDGIERAIGYQRGSEPTSSVPPTQHDFPFYLFLLLLIPATAVGWVALKDRSVKAVV